MSLSFDDLVCSITAYMNLSDVFDSPYRFAKMQLDCQIFFEVPDTRLCKTIQ